MNTNSIQQHKHVHEHRQHSATQTRSWTQATLSNTNMFMNIGNTQQHKHVHEHKQHKPVHEHKQHKPVHEHKQHSASLIHTHTHTQATLTPRKCSFTHISYTTTLQCQPCRSTDTTRDIIAPLCGSDGNCCATGSCMCVQELLLIYRPI